MKTPEVPKENMENGMPEWHEPFPKPQTIPSGWDLSELFSASSSVAFEDSDESAED